MKLCVCECGKYTAEIVFDRAHLCTECKHNLYNLQIEYGATKSIKILKMLNNRKLSNNHKQTISAYRDRI